MHLLKTIHLNEMRANVEQKSRTFLETANRNVKHKRMFMKYFCLFWYLSFFLYMFITFRLFMWVSPFLKESQIAFVIKLYYIFSILLILVSAFFGKQFLLLFWLYMYKSFRKRTKKNNNFWWILIARDSFEHGSTSERTKIIFGKIKLIEVRLLWFFFFMKLKVGF